MILFQDGTATSNDTDCPVDLSESIVEVENDTVALYREEHYREYTFAFCNKTGHWEMEKGLRYPDCLFRT